MMPSIDFFGISKMQFGIFSLTTRFIAIQEIENIMFKDINGITN